MRRKDEYYQRYLTSLTAAPILFVCLFVCSLTSSIAAVTSVMIWPDVEGQRESRREELPRLIARLVFHRNSSNLEPADCVYSYPSTQQHTILAWELYSATNEARTTDLRIAKIGGLST